MFLSLSQFIAVLLCKERASNIPITHSLTILLYCGGVTCSKPCCINLLFNFRFLWCFKALLFGWHAKSTCYIFQIPLVIQGLFYQLDLDKFHFLLVFQELIHYGSKINLPTYFRFSWCLLARHSELSSL